MTTPISQLRRIVTLAICMLAAAAAPGQISPSPIARMDAFALSPEVAGVLVYRGDTFDQRGTDRAPLYRYERRVLVMPGALTASHLTRDPAGKLIIVESAAVSLDYEMQRFEVANQQAGFSGTVLFSQDGRRLEYELNDNGKLSKASEVVTFPVVSGPSLFGFILKNWEPLTTGMALPVRMLVMQEKTTYGFDIRFEKLSNGQATFTITPSNFLIRMAIAPMRVVFDVNTKTPIRYEGRVPPMENVAGRLKSLDARVEYSRLTATYR